MIFRDEKCTNFPVPSSIYRRPGPWLQDVWTGICPLETDYWNFSWRRIQRPQTLLQGKAEFNCNENLQLHVPGLTLKKRANQSDNFSRLHNTSSYESERCKRREAKRLIYKTLPCHTPCKLKFVRSSRHISQTDFYSIGGFSLDSSLLFTK